ncbi:MAG: Mu transposase C-terminal domain-containing protein, partial [Ruminococcus sp.]|nr:Mu transposase C-terminal domain-containing protein [Ruminococcus sp.]
PSEKTFRRQIDHDVSYALKTLMRDGKKTFDDRCSPYIIRLYDKLEANDCWIADNHTLDIISLDGETKHRLYLTAFLDAKSGVLTGWNITDSPDSQSTILALRHGIMRFGVPKAIYVDNGREFLTYDFGGKGHRKRKSHDSKSEPTTILERLGIEMHNAIVRNAKAKPIERTFYTVKNQFSRLWDGFCGGTIIERKESLKRIIKNGQLPCDYDVRRVLSAWIDNEYNKQPYGGSECCFKNMSRLDVWNATITEIRETTPDMLNLLMMRSERPQKIRRNGVYVTISNEKIWFMHEQETINNLEKEVFVRYDPADLRTVRIYDAEDDSFLFEWQNASYLMVDFLEETQKNIADAQEKIRATKKFVKEQAKGITENLSQEQRITMLDMLIKSAENAEEPEIRRPKRIVPIIANEESAALAKAVGAEDFDDYYSELEELRAMNDRLERAKKGV